MPETPVPDLDKRDKRDITPGETAAPKRLRVDDPDQMSDDGDGNLSRLNAASSHKILNLNSGWDFRMQKHQDAVVKLIEHVKPELIVGNTLLP